jgi:hypothetical protein
MHFGSPMPILMIALTLGALAVPVAAQQVPSRAGICEGAVCGPSGGFSSDSFPTLTNIRWDAFPANVPREQYVAAMGARAIYVAPGGSDAAPGTRNAPLGTLNHAVSIARAGDVIWVADGEYRVGLPDEYEALVLSKPQVTLAAERIGGAVLVPARENHRVGLRVEADGVTVDGFVVRGFAEVGVEFGRITSPQVGLVLKHLLVERSDEGIRSVYGGNRRQPLTDGVLLYDIWLRDIAFIGLQCGEGPCHSLRLEALRIEMPSGDDEDSGADAIALEAGDNIVVFNAEVSGASGDGIDLKSASAVVANVVVHDIGRNGIKIWYGGDIINALVYNTGADAALVFEAGIFRILNTLVARHAWGGRAYTMTAAYDSPREPGRMEIINSVFYQNAGAVWISPGMALDVRNSLWFGAGNGMVLEWGGNLLIGAGERPISALEALGAGKANRDTVDPRFANPNAGDFSWGANSPLRDTGTAAVPLPSFDLLGRPRIAGRAVDLGPWELP